MREGRGLTTAPTLLAQRHERRQPTQAPGRVDVEPFEATTSLCGRFFAFMLIAFLTFQPLYVALATDIDSTEGVVASPQEADASQDVPPQDEPDPPEPELNEAEPEPPQEASLPDSTQTSEETPPSTDDGSTTLDDPSDVLTDENTEADGSASGESVSQESASSENNETADDETGVPAATTTEVADDEALEEPPAPAATSTSTSTATSTSTTSSDELESGSTDDVDGGADTGGGSSGGGTDSSSTTEASQTASSTNEESGDTSGGAEPESVDTTGGSSASSTSELATSTLATTTPSSTPALIIADDRFTIGEHECMVLEDGNFYCSKAGDAGVPDAEDFGPSRVAAREDHQGDKEIFLLESGKTVQLTFNDYDDLAPMQDSATLRIAWHALINERLQIMLYDRTTGATRQITDTTYNNSNPYLYGDTLVWQAWVDNNWEIYMAEQLNRQEPTITRLSENSRHDMFPKIFDTYITWEAETVDGWHVVIYDRETERFSLVKKRGDGKYENPRFALLIDNRSEDGAIETIGYDVANDEEIPLTPIPMPAPDPVTPVDDTGAAVLPGTASSTKLEEGEPNEG